MFFCFGAIVVLVTWSTSGVNRITYIGGGIMAIALVVIIVRCIQHQHQKQQAGPSIVVRNAANYNTTTVTTIPAQPTGYGSYPSQPPGGYPLAAKPGEYPQAQQHYPPQQCYPPPQQGYPPPQQGYPQAQQPYPQTQQAYPPPQMQEYPQPGAAGQLQSGGYPTPSDNPPPYAPPSYEEANTPSAPTK